jgi:YVTN family beta-propeller protein
VAYNPANDQIYVANGLANTVTVLRAGDYGWVKTIPVGSAPGSVSVRSAANWVYVANSGGDSVSIIDGATNNVIKTVAVGDEPSGIAVNPNTGHAYVTLHGAGSVARIDPSGNLLPSLAVGAAPFGITVDVVRNLIYVATIDSYRIAVLDGIAGTFLGSAEIRRSDGTPVPLRQIAVNPSIGSSGHVFLTTVGEDGGFDRFLLLAKGWPEFFDLPVALDLDEAQEGIAFDAASQRVFVTSRTENRVQVYRDGEPRCPYNLSGEYKLIICVADPDGTCREVFARQ